MTEVNGTLRIEFVERETLGGRTWGAKQIQVERMEDNSLLVMIVHLAPVVLDIYSYFSRKKTYILLLNVFFRFRILLENLFHTSICPQNKYYFK